MIKDKIIIGWSLERIRLVKVFDLDYCYYLRRLMEEMPLRIKALTYK